MKNIVHLFSRDTIEKALERSNSGAHELTTAARFEFIAAMMMQRMYEEQWKKPTMIGFYLTSKYADLLAKTEQPDTETLIAALICGIEENNPIDFLICTYDQEDGAHQEFQLKRFGMHGTNDSASLIVFLDGMAKKYTKTDAACLVAIADISSIDFERVSAAINKDAFPFSELLFVGVHNDKFIVAGLKPADGWSAYDLPAVVS